MTPIKTPSPPFRPGTKIAPTPVALIYNAGGIGDYIHWTQAIKYVIQSYPWISGYVITPKFFSDLAHLWLDGFSDRFGVREEAVSDYATLPYLNDHAIIIPDNKQLASAPGFHLFQLGFIYYNQHHKIPAGWNTLPEIKGDEVDISGFALPEKYVVLTPNATVEVRKLNSAAINEVVMWLKWQNITPVFLGLSDMAKDHKSSAHPDLKLDGVLDLRDKTSLRESACIMARAKAVVGLDNGLLHLACCSSVPVVFAFTTINPELRVPPRKKGAETIVIAPPASLPCRFCNSEIRYVIGHDFKTCLYGSDIKCVTSISGKALIEGLRKVL